MKLFVCGLLLFAFACDQVEPDQSLMNKQVKKSKEEPSATANEPVPPSLNAVDVQEPTSVLNPKPNQTEEPEAIVNVNVEFSFLKEENRLTYEADIKPIMDKHCVGCHGSAGEMSLREFNFTWYDDSSDSVQNDIVDEMIVRMEDEDDPMPPVSKRREPMTQQEIDIIKKWQQDGLKKGEKSNDNELTVVVDALDASGSILETQKQILDASGSVNVEFQKDGIESVLIKVFKAQEKITSKTLEVTGLQAKGVIEIQSAK